MSLPRLRPLLLILASWITTSAVAQDDDDADLDEIVQCCDERGCVEGRHRCDVPTMKLGPRPLAVSENSADKRIVAEHAMGLQEFGDRYLPRHTLRGQVATALLHPKFSDLFVGEIEGEYAQWMPDIDSGEMRIVTWCSIRAREKFRGPVNVGELVNVLYDGGAVDQDNQSWPPHRPRCLPFDVQLIAVVTLPSDGVPRPDSITTRSLEPWAIPWQEHPAVELARTLAAEVAP